MKRTIPAVATIMLIIWACSPKFKVSSDAPQPGKFKNYRTFMFFNPDKIPASNLSFSEENKSFIFDAIAAEMHDRDFKSIQKADIVIKVQGGTKSTQEVRNDRNSGFYDPYYRYGYPYGGNFDNQYQDISKKETTIIVDMLDAETDQLVWQGVGVGVLGKRKEDVVLKIREAIMLIFETFPYRAAK